MLYGYGINPQGEGQKLHCFDLTNFLEYKFNICPDSWERINYTYFPITFVYMIQAKIQTFIVIRSLTYSLWPIAEPLILIMAK